MCRFSQDDCPTSDTSAREVGRERGSRSLGLLLWACAAAIFFVIVSPATGQLISEPFSVTHHLVQTEGDEAPIVGDSVTDYYGGSWIVSVAPGDRRMIIDLAREELTEVNPAEGSYWRLTFGELARLRRQHQAVLERRYGRPLEAREAESELKARAAQGDSGSPQVVVREVSTTTLVARSASPAARELLATPGVRQLEVSVRRGAEEEKKLDLWVQPEVRLSSEARAALTRFEGTALAELTSVGSTATVKAHELMGAARDFAEGAFVVRSLQSLRIGGIVSTLEDVATRLQPLPTFPLEMVEIPEGLRRVPHPLEQIISVMEKEEELLQPLTPTLGEDVEP